MLFGRFKDASALYGNVRRDRSISIDQFRRAAGCRDSLVELRMLPVGGFEIRSFS